MGRISRTSNPAYLLRLIGDGIDTRSKLLARLGLKGSLGTKAAVLDRTIHSLESVGLVDVKTRKRGSKTYRELTVSRQFKAIQGTLRISLTNLANLSQGNCMVITPFIDPPALKKGADVFVLMPFEPYLKPVYKKHIVPVVEALELSVKRADEISSSGAIMKDIWESIVRCKIIIADCTGKNPNVFYEIGIAHTLGKSVILLTQEKTDVPFDIQHMRYIPYKPTKNGLELLDAKLRTALEEEFQMETEVALQEE